MSRTLRYLEILGCQCSKTENMTLFLTLPANLFSRILKLMEMTCTFDLDCVGDSIKETSLYPLLKETRIMTNSSDIDRVYNSMTTIVACHVISEFERIALVRADDFSFYEAMNYIKSLVDRAFKNQTISSLNKKDFYVEVKKK